TPPGASGLRSPADFPRPVVVVSHCPWCPFRLAVYPCGQPPTVSAPFSASPAAVVSTLRTGNARTCTLFSSVPPKTPWAPKVRDEPPDWFRLKVGYGKETRDCPDGAGKCLIYIA